MITLLPPFTTDGVLPPTPDGTPHVCTRDEVDRHFVAAFGNAPWRRTLFDGWDLLRSSIAQHVPSARWWLWGSLITAIPEPLSGERATVSAVLHIDTEALPSAASGLGLLGASVHSALHLHSVDTHLLIHRPSLAPDELALWARRASQAIVDPQSREMIPAGYIEVQP